MRYLLSVSTAAMVAALGAMPVLAQSTATAVEASNQTSSPEAVPGDIVVTALKRDTTVQHAPIAIAALTGQQLSAAGVVNITDVAKLTPGLVIVDAGPGSRRVVVRGIQGPGEPTVGVYVDETPVIGSSGTANDAGAKTPEIGLFDVQRIEVLRGPQGTLYGSGSMGGTFRVITNKPEFGKWGASVDGTGVATKSGGKGGDINGEVNVPIADNVAARVVMFYRDAPGYIDNSRTGQNNTGDYRTVGGRAMLRYQPIDRLTLDAAAFYQRSRGSQPYWFPNLGRYGLDTYLQQPIADTLHLYSLTAHYDAGPVTITAVTSYLDRYQETSNDLDGYYRSLLGSSSKCASLYNHGAACGASTLTAYNNHILSLLPTSAYQQQTVHDWSNELRASSSGDTRLKWTVGIFASKRSTSVDSPQWTGDAATGEIITPPIVTSDRVIQTHLNQYAIFGEASYQLLKKLTLTFGIRGFKYDQTNAGQTTIGLDLLGTTANARTVVKASSSGKVLKFNASYQVDSNNMFYAEAAQGFRPGGVNQVLGLPANFAPYKSDSLWNYELGYKSDWLNHKLIFDIDVFDIEWHNMQTSATTTNGAFSFIANAGAARVRGVELDIGLRPVRGLELHATGSYQDARLTQDQTNAGLAAPGKDGNRIPYVPMKQGNISAQYTTPLTETINGTARVDASYIGNSYSSFPPTDIRRVKLPSYEQVNLRAGIEAPDGNWGAYIFARNLLDKVGIAWAANNATTGYVPEVASIAPRTIGINLRKRF